MEPIIGEAIKQGGLLAVTLVLIWRFDVRLGALVERMDTLIQTVQSEQHR